MTSRARLFGVTLFAAVLLAVPSQVLATNGMYLAGYGSEAGGRGGANIAVADRALGLQANPAGIAQLQGNHFSIDLQILMPEMNWSGDAFGNDLDAKNRKFFMPSFSYVRGGKDTKWTWGIGFISQGGMGATFENYRTPFNPSDQTYSQVRFATINPTVSYSFTDNLSLGLTANLGWSDVAFRFWPGSSSDGGTPPDPSDDFYGANLYKSASAFNYAARLGLMWRLNPKWQIGAVYQTKTEGDYEDGELALNMDALIGTETKYSEASVMNFTWPEQYGIGIQWRPGEKWMLAFDAKEYKWEDAVSLVTVEGKNPDQPLPPEAQTVQLPFALLWENQTVYALGVEYRFNHSFTLRAGANHGDSVVPDSSANPLFPAITEDHATLGLGYNWGSNTFNFAVERAFEAEQTNSNTNPMMDPFAGGTIKHSQWTVSFGWSKAFSRGKKK